MPARRPLLPPSVEVAVMVCCAAAVASVAAVAGPLVLGLALWVAGGVVAWGWAGLLALPAPRGTSVVLYAGSLALILTAVIDEQPPWLTWVPVALALGLIAAFVHQLLRVDGRPRIVESVSAIVLGLGVMTCGVLLIPLTASVQGSVLIVACLAGAAASAVSDILGRVVALRPWLVPMALLVGGGAGALVAVLMNQAPPTYLLAGVVAGAVSHAVRSVHRTLPTMAHPRPRLVVAICSLLVTGPIAYAVALGFLPGFSLA